MKAISFTSSLLILLSFTAHADPTTSIKSTVTFSNREVPCFGSFLESKAGEAEPVLTVASCLENFHSGGLEIRTSRGEVIRSQDVTVHPSLIESRQNDPQKVSEEVALAVVFFPAGTKIDTSNMDQWQYPVGTVLWKDFKVNGTRMSAVGQR